MRAIRDLSVVAAMAMAVMSVPAAAQGQRPPDPQQIVRATGEAVVYVQPDQVQIDIGVMTESQSAEQAARDNAAKVEKVMAALRRELGPNASIRTLNYSLYPQYRGEPRDGVPVAQTYQANNVLRIESNKMDQVGKIADVAISAGANIIQSVNFMLRDQSEARASALRDAARQARSKVDVMAGALGLRVLRVLAVEEGGAITPLYRERMEMSATMIESGSVEVRALVTVAAEVAPG